MYYNKCLSVLSNGEIRYKTSLKRKKNMINHYIFLKILDWEIFLNSQFWENFKEIRIGTGAEYLPQIGSIKPAEY